MFEKLLFLALIFLEEIIFQDTIYLIKILIDE